MYIYNALLHHGYSAFSLTVFWIYRYFNLSEDKAKTLILEREQLNLDTLSPEYNILATAGSRLGSSHSEDTKASISEARIGKTHSAETKTKISSTKGTAIYVYDSDGTLAYSFTSARKAAEIFNCCHKTIKKYAIDDARPLFLN